MEINEGDKIIAKDNFAMQGGIDEGKLFLIKGKEYEVLIVRDTIFSIESEIDDSHIFGISDFDEFFTIDKKDAIVESVITKYLNRSKVGIKKYGTTLEENNKDNFLNHLQEELFDASLYIEKLMSNSNYENITNKVLDWAEQRNLLDLENSYKQYGKLQEESLELYNAMLDNNNAEIKDALGDIGVVMIILANQLGYDFFECIEKAYEVIKNRKGKTINGTFVKDEDECSGGYLG